MQAPTLLEMHRALTRCTAPMVGHGAQPSIPSIRVASPTGWAVVKQPSTTPLPRPVSATPMAFTRTVLMHGNRPGSAGSIRAFSGLAVLPRPSSNCRRLAVLVSMKVRAYDASQVGRDPRTISRQTQAETLSAGNILILPVRPRLQMIYLSRKESS